MDFEVYCDESGQELFKNLPPGEHYTLIGGIWLRSEDREKYKADIGQIRKIHKLYGEFKWNRVSPSRIDFYIEIVKWFFKNDLRFRVLVLRSDELNAVRFHASDNELMFYKFYYQLLHHWILDSNNYRIFVDTRTNRLHNRLRILESCLRNSNLTSTVAVQALPSDQLDLIQVADLLIGAVSYKFHGRKESNSKLRILKEVEKRWGRKIGSTSKCEEKFNVFRFLSGGGW